MVVSHARSLPNLHRLPAGGVFEYILQSKRGGIVIEATKRITPFSIASLKAGKKHSAQTQGAMYPLQNITQRTNRDMKKTGTRPDAIEPCFPSDFAKPKHCHRPAEAFFSLSRHGRSAVGRKHIIPEAQHFGGVTPRTTPQFKDRRASG